MARRVTTAVIAVAGTGSRVFPLTTAIEKCMLPIYAVTQSRPLVDFIVRDCALAGIRRIIFVTTERGRQQLQDYFAVLPEQLADQLQALGKTDLITAESSRRAAYDITFEYVVQPLGEYGTAVPLALVQPLLEGEEYFAYMGGDDFVWHANPNSSELLLALQTWQTAGTPHLLMGNPVSRLEAPKYGILQVGESGHLRAIDEKPPLERVPDQPLANISKYVFSCDIWPFISAEMKTDRLATQSEHYITYVIDAAIAAGQSCAVHQITGDFLDGGSLDGLLAASLHISQRQTSTVWRHPSEAAR